jgi:hypothetical protein
MKPGNQGVAIETGEFVGLIELIELEEQSSSVAGHSARHDGLDAGGVDARAAFGGTGHADRRHSKNETH